MNNPQDRFRLDHQDGLMAFVDELGRREEGKKDFLVNTDSDDLSFHSMGSSVFGFDLDTNGERSTFQLNNHAHGQLAGRLDIPKKYYDHMREEAPELLEENVRHWLEAKPSRTMLRTLDGKVRAVLSDRYRPIDNFDLGMGLLKAISHQNLRQIESAITDRKMYIKAIDPSISEPIDDELFRQRFNTRRIVNAGFVFSNSEVGAGAVKIEAMIWDEWCSNGMIRGINLSRHHVGRKADDLGCGDITEYLSDETHQADDKAFMLRLRDTIKATVNPGYFRAMVQKIKEGTSRQLGANPQGVVEVIGKRHDLLEAEKEAVMAELMTSGDPTQWGITCAVTRMAQETGYDRRVELERIGSKIIEFPQNGWSELLQEVS